MGAKTREGPDPDVGNLRAMVYRLPNGRRTASVHTYVRAWRRAGAVLERLCGWTLAAFDPDLVYRRRNGRLLTVELTEVQQIIQAAREGRKL